MLLKFEIDTLNVLCVVNTEGNEMNHYCAFSYEALKFYVFLVLKKKPLEWISAKISCYRKIT